MTISIDYNKLGIGLNTLEKNMKTFLLQSDDELPLVAEVLIQLRPQYTIESLIEQINKQRELGYHIAYVKEGNKVLSVAGFVEGEKLAWGKSIYIDDLVTDENSRSTGAGTLLIDWFKSYCKEIGCKQLHLDSGVQRFQAHKFYLREGFAISSHHFSIENIGIK